MKIFINGKPCQASQKENVLEVALMNNIYIPHLCYHSKTGHAGRCRACVVEVEGIPDLKTSCTLEIQEGMKVYTNTDKVKESQRVIVDLALSSGHHDCLSCEQNGNCELQDAAYYLGIEKPSYDLAEEFEMDDSSEFIYVDRSKCIKCGRCVAGCNNTVVNDVLNFGNRGFETKIIFDSDLPMGTSSCVQCGECMQLCPVGAIIDKRAIGKGRPWELETTETVCPYCGVGCKLEVHVNKKHNEIVKITGVEDSITNNGMLCVKGRYGFDFVQSHERITQPLLKEDGKLREAEWDEAIALIANKFKSIKEEYGPNSLAGLASAKVTNEENFVFQKFFRREVGTNNVDHCARLCHSSTVAGLAASLGSGAMTNDISGIKEADVIMIIGSDTSEAHPVIAARIKQAVKEGKTQLIVLDPKKIKMADYAEIYAAHFPGTDVMLLNSIMQEIIKNDWHDKKYIEERLESFEDFKEEILNDKYKPENAAKITGVAAETIRDIANMFANAKTAAVFYAMGITQHVTGRDNVWTIANLQMITGNLGKPGGGVNPLRGQSNVQGACDMGGLPNVYPGYQKVSDPKVQEKFENAWQRKMNPKVGLTVTEMIDGAYDGKIKALYVMGENPYLSDPDQNHVIAALERTEFLVVQDMFLTETAEFADVILPAASYLEKEGHFTNTERRIQRLNKALEAPGKAKSDWEIIQLIANKMDAGWNYKHVKDITAEINELTPQYAGITWERVGRDGLQWPCPTENHPGTAYLHKDRFARGLGLLNGITFQEPDELPDEEYPLIMTTGRVLQQFHTGTMSRKTEGLNRIAGPMVMMSVEDAEKLEIGNSEKVRVSTRRGSIETPAFITKRISKGVIYIPFHYKEAPANRLTNPALDPVAKIPEYKVCAAKIEKIVNEV
ncbi:MAG: formate dehydrogenase subunit alpha [Candidatus Cloacimonadota bacterium]|nr:formate dehydrogenase subunit alpha [Candidatus Cloacimonadota bacterium]